MSYSKTEAISLSFRQTKEADRLYTLFSSEQGKVEVLVKAGAKSQSKLAGSLDIWFSRSSTNLSLAIY
ncbi:MAG: recombination protein O N-terminal domain-containing protein [Candidatus Komeilibacteria bacterium]|nr:recombination protein O N-terminal domain-containing protein [Candidatus Komeilibacteria bacterium]